MKPFTPIVENSPTNTHPSWVDLQMITKRNAYKSHVLKFYESS